MQTEGKMNKFLFHALSLLIIFLHPSYSTSFSNFIDDNKKFYAERQHAGREKLHLLYVLQ